MPTPTQTAIHIHSFSQLICLSLKMLKDSHHRISQSNFCAYIIRNGIGNSMQHGSILGPYHTAPFPIVFRLRLPHVQAIAPLGILTADYDRVYRSLAARHDALDMVAFIVMCGVPIGYRYTRKRIGTTDWAAVFSRSAIMTGATYAPKFAS